MHVWTRTYTDECSRAADSNTDLVFSDDTAFYKIKYQLTTYLPFKKEKRKKALVPSLSDLWLSVCNFVLVCCAVQSVVHCKEAVCGTLECSLDKAWSSRPEISFMAMSTLTFFKVNRVFIIFLLHSSVEACIYRGIFNSVTLYVLFGSQYLHTWV